MRSLKVSGVCSAILVDFYDSDLMRRITDLHWENGDYPWFDFDRSCSLFFQYVEVLIYFVGLYFEFGNSDHHVIRIDIG